MPLLSALNLGSLLSALGLVTSLLKPVPIVGDLVPGLLGTLIPIVNQTLSNLPILAAVPGDGGDGDDDGSASLTGVTMPVCNNIVSYAKSIVPLQPFAPFDLAMSNVFRYRQQQSVNLGSWFVQEAWMNPTLFVCAAGNKSSELDVAMGYGGNVDSARMSLEMHWDTWIKEEDFAYLQKIGINTVRLPIGFWSLGPTYTQGTPFESVSDAYVNSWPRIVRAINWAAKYGLGVLVDLHGAPGSQNGQGHGGTSDGIIGLFDSPTYMAQTINILTFLTQQLVEVTNVVGIELLNEPSNVDGLPDFYTKALQTLRQVSPSAQKFPFYIHDGFDMSRFADYVAARQDFLVLDHHQYFVFAPSDPTESSASLAADIKSGVSSDLISAAKRSRGNLVVDEFSCALSSQALNTETDKAAARATYCTGQMETYANGTAGWSFWSYRTESCPTDNDWCFLKAVGNSLPTSFFSYPGNYPIQPAPGTVSASNPLIIPGILSPLSPIALQLKAIPIPSSATVLAYANPPSGSDALAAIQSSLIVAPEVDVDLQRPYVGVGGMAVVGSAGAKKEPAGAAAAGGEEEEQASGEEDATDEEVEETTRRRKRSQQESFVAPRLPPGKFLAKQLRQLVTRKQAALAAPPPPAPASLTPAQTATAKGYSDGFQTAKVFALSSGSRLGFTNQYIADSLAALTTILTAQQPLYTEWFLRGLADGENQVAAVLAEGDEMGTILVAVAGQVETAPAPSSSPSASTSSEESSSGDDESAEDVEDGDDDDSN